MGMKVIRKPKPNLPGMSLTELYSYIHELEDENARLEESFQKATGEISSDPLPIHAHWIDRTYWYGNLGKCEYECSHCGYRINHKPQSRGDGKGGKFCDECGAIMDKTEE